MEHFSNFINNIGLSLIGDCVVAVLMIAFFTAFLLKKRNFRLLIVIFVYVACFVTMSVFESITQGKMFYIGTILFRYMTFFFMVAFCVVYSADLKSLFAKLSTKRDDVHYATHGSSEDDLQLATEEIVKATQVLSKNDTGALIVVCQGAVPSNVVETGTRLNCVVSAAVLESIFNTKSPLHDGAVVVKNNTILAAGCFLPLTQRNDLSRDFGTRHRAAIGITEEANVLSIVVSEESGIVSVVKNKGEVKRYMTSERLTEELEHAYGIAHIGKNQIKRYN